jgi:hypothetical protein
MWPSLSLSSNTESSAMDSKAKQGG